MLRLCFLPTKKKIAHARRFINEHWQGNHTTVLTLIQLSLLISIAQYRQIFASKTIMIQMYALCMLKYVNASAP